MLLITDQFHMIDLKVVDAEIPTRKLSPETVTLEVTPLTDPEHFLKEVLAGGVKVVTSVFSARTSARFTAELNYEVPYFQTPVLLAAGDSILLGYTNSCHNPFTTWILVRVK